MAEDLQAVLQQSSKLLVKVTGLSLSTSMQPVSIVVTGAFDFESVTINDDTSKNKKDEPSKIPDDTTENPSNKPDNSGTDSVFWLLQILSSLAL